MIELIIYGVALFILCITLVLIHEPRGTVEYCKEPTYPKPPRPGEKKDEDR